MLFQVSNKFTGVAFATACRELSDIFAPDGRNHSGKMLTYGASPTTGDIELFFQTRDNPDNIELNVDLLSPCQQSQLMLWKLKYCG